jgi:nitroimidazol reductase NimA-like FMN-containing flavoprotein (pyridoxamine 5'-phosphate oxidase superfamily)
MSELRELDLDECERLLASGVAGRVAVSTPDGPHIVPINYSVYQRSVVFRTSPYSVLGTYGRGAQLAFEIDHIDYDRHQGWSVVVRGRGDVVADLDEQQLIEAEWPPRPWAEGVRTMMFRIPFEEVSGRRLGSRGAAEARLPHRTVSYG